MLKTDKNRYSIKFTSKIFDDSEKILLFVREFKKDPVSGRAAPYTFLGTANYVNHQGEKPMNITWELENPIPAKYLKKTNKLLAG